MRTERPFTGSLAPRWSSKSLLSEAIALARDATAALSANNMALSMNSPESEPGGTRLRGRLKPSRDAANTDRVKSVCLTAAFFRSGPTAECQTWSGVEFPERPGCAVKGLSS